MQWHRGSSRQQHMAPPTRVDELSDEGAGGSPPTTAKQCAETPKQAKTPTTVEADVEKTPLPAAPRSVVAVPRSVVVVPRGSAPLQGGRAPQSENSLQAAERYG